MVVSRLGIVSVENQPRGTMKQGKTSHCVASGWIPSEFVRLVTWGNTIQRALKVLGLVTCLVSCSGLVATTVVPTSHGNVSVASAVDVIVVMDNSTTMFTPQLVFGEALREFATALFHPVESSARERPPESLHLGILSTSLGGLPPTDGSCGPIPGDDANFHPARFGAEQGRIGLRPYPTIPGLGCRTAREYPAWFSTRGAQVEVEGFSRDVACAASLGNFGCAFRQPLEVARRRLLAENRMPARPDGGMEGGFLREDSIVVVLVISSADDASIRDCNFSGSDAATCDDATSVTQFSSSSRWAATEPETRIHRYIPCSDNDPTWRLERYHHPSDASQGFLGLRPSHPERVLFAAIAGVPSRPSAPLWGAEVEDWNLLLGRPSTPSGVDFCTRDTSTAFAGHDDVGPVTMRPGVDIGCFQRVMPACRRRQSFDRLACEPEGTFAAVPARRLAEIARRFDEAPLCSGHPCRNGFMTSVCQEDYRPVLRSLARRVRQRLAGSVE